MPKYRDIYIGMDYDLVLVITKSIAFPAAAADGTWTWTLKIDKERTAGGTADVVHDADSAVLSNGDLTITLTFNVPKAKMVAPLEAGLNQIDIESDDGSDKVLPWPEARGPVRVLLPLGT